MKLLSMTYIWKSLLFTECLPGPTRCVKGQTQTSYSLSLNEITVNDLLHPTILCVSFLATTLSADIQSTLWSSYNPWFCHLIEYCNSHSKHVVPVQNKCRCMAFYAMLQHAYSVHTVLLATDDCIARTSAICNTIGQCGNAVRTPLWYDRALLHKKQR